MNEWINQNPKPFEYNALSDEATVATRALLKDKTLDIEKLIKHMNTLGRLKLQINVINYNPETKEVRFHVLNSGHKVAAFKDAIQPYYVSTGLKPTYSMKLDAFIEKLLVPYGGKIKARSERWTKDRSTPVTEKTLSTLLGAIDALKLPLRLVDPEAGAYALDFVIRKSPTPLDWRVVDALKQYQSEPTEDQDPNIHRVHCNHVPQIMSVIDTLLDERLNGKPTSTVSSVKIQHDLKPLLAPTDARDDHELTRIAHQCYKALLAIHQRELRRGVHHQLPSTFHMTLARKVGLSDTVGEFFHLPADLFNALGPINRVPVKRYGNVVIHMRKDADALVDTINNYVNSLPAAEAKELYDSIREAVSPKMQKGG